MKRPVSGSFLRRSRPRTATRFGRRDDARTSEAGTSGITRPLARSAHHLQRTRAGRCHGPVRGRTDGCSSCDDASSRPLPPPASPGSKHRDYVLWVDVGNVDALDVQFGDGREVDAPAFDDGAYAGHGDAPVVRLFLEGEDAQAGVAGV